jgi:hypothetical protein
MNQLSVLFQKSGWRYDRVCTARVTSSQLNSSVFDHLLSRMVVSSTFAREESRTEAPAIFGDDGIFVDARNAGTNMCVDIFGNNSDGTGAGRVGIRVQQRSAGSPPTFRLERLASPM